MKNKSKILVCIPVMDEMDFLPATVKCITEQFFTDFMVYFCVNQPADYWQSKDKIHVCYNNEACLEYLSKISAFPNIVLDFSSPGRGWTAKKSGVGWARKVIMDKAAEEGLPNDIILSLDADTLFNPDYFASIHNNFNRNEPVSALAVPYYHRLTSDSVINRAILRYEIYLRYYFLNLARIKSPYAFTAIGSAMAVRVSEYRKVKGITPHKSGEDFYFIEKLAKSKPVSNWNEERVYPSARLSDRVLFGTGPALIKGVNGNWDSYPIYASSSFDEIAATYQLFPDLYMENLTTPMSEFLTLTLKTFDFWDKLRNNSGSSSGFIRACHQRIDGLRILQYLRYRHKSNVYSDEQNLVDFIEKYFAEVVPDFYEEGSMFSFSGSRIEILDKIRNTLCCVEDRIRKEQSKFMNK